MPVKAGNNICPLLIYSCEEDVVEDYLARYGYPPPSVAQRSAPAARASPARPPLPRTMARTLPLALCLSALGAGCMHAAALSHPVFASASRLRVLSPVARLPVTDRGTIVPGLRVVDANSMMQTRHVQSAANCRDGLTLKGVLAGAVKATSTRRLEHRRSCLSSLSTSAHAAKSCCPSLMRRMTPHSRAHTPRHVSPVAAANRPGGDLHGGMDDERNANIATLKELFYDDVSGGADVDAAAAQRGLDSVRLGRLTDVPFARWSMVLLPHQQVLLNVFQPQYTLMFEALLRTPKPWYYLHVLLPGGTANLDNEEYALPQGTFAELGAEQMAAGRAGLQDGDGPNARGVQRRAGARASLCGTLMEVVDVAWQADSRLAVVVQGVCRAVVVRATQTTPYARGEVQRLPDVEQMLSALCASSAWLRRVRAWERAAGSEPATGNLNSEPESGNPNPASEISTLNSASGTNEFDSAPEAGVLSAAFQVPPSVPSSASAGALSFLNAAPISVQAEARIMMAAAVAEDVVWQAYERERISLGNAVPPAMCTFNTSAAE
eukprot:6201032-Pleurochrysis_carterae.AAC.1